MSSLQSKTIAITRGMHEAREFFQLVKTEGGSALAIPVVEIVPASPKVAIQFMTSLKKKHYDYCAFMSAQAVNVLFGLTDGVADALEKTSVIAVGPKTRKALGKHGVNVEMVPVKFSSIGLVELLSGIDVRGKRIIIPRSGDANEFVAKSLSDLDMEVEEVFLYRTRRAKLTPELKELVNLLTDNRIDAIVFTSASNVRAFFAMLRKMRKETPRNVKAVSIGPCTTAELKKQGITCYEADDHTVKGTVDVLKKLFNQK